MRGPELKACKLLANNIIISIQWTAGDGNTNLHELLQISFGKSLLATFRWRGTRNATDMWLPFIVNVHALTAEDDVMLRSKGRTPSYLLTPCRAPPSLVPRPLTFLLWMNDLLPLYLLCVKPLNRPVLRVVGPKSFLFIVSEPLPLISFRFSSSPLSSSLFPSWPQSLHSSLLITLCGRWLSETFPTIKKWSICIFCQSIPIR